MIVLAGFEVGDDTGDAPGEFQYWAEREHLDGTLEIKGAPHPLRFNHSGLYGSVAGNTRDPEMTTVPASELIMALCLDPRLDLTHTYWLINGISGIDPEFGPIGSAVWAANVVDGDAMREIDESEVPGGWPYGLFAIGTDGPNRLPAAHTEAGGWGGATLTYTMNYALNPGLTRWAYDLSRRQARLDDSPALKAWRDKFTDHAPARQPPQILTGGTLASARYWHGPRRTQWARDWVKLWTQGKDSFATTAMEQAAYVGTLRRLSAKGLVDFNRVMMLRSASNYCLPPSGQSVLSTIGDEGVGTLAAYEAQYRAGSVVVHELLAHWERYEKAVPSSQ
ncbi:MAG TPA: purine nucleoside permease [Candidatus Didemnitutus sp.]|nr:purine nucleoside permease [Candidatus Didemnitutus sp.]